jgi:hypothetical protein
VRDPDDKATTPPAEQRQVSPTGIVKMHVDDNDTKVDVAKIQADVEKAKLATLQSIAMWSGGVFALVCVVGLALYYEQGAVAVVVVGLAVAALAVYLGRSFVFRAAGIGVGTGDAAKPPESP